jgi:DNA-binding helix-hairpin-helix protein with protein kinase domain
MSKPLDVKDSRGRSVNLGKELGAGGEAKVFSVDRDSARVVKIYHKEPDAEQVAKLNALTALANPKLLAVAAWPTGLLYNSNRRVVGIEMPRFSDDFRPVQQLYNPQQRLKQFPKSGWNFQVRAALNLAAAFDEVHQTGCLVGDVNESNAMVSNAAIIRLVDCDSFQVSAGGRIFRCPVGKPEYTAPDLQGKPYGSIVRTPQHDLFGLAVLIFQLLFVGRHPFAGIEPKLKDATIEEKISQYRFAYGPRAVSLHIKTPPFVPRFDELPVGVAQLFRTAFEQPSGATQRPTAASWVRELRRLDGEIKTCTADDGHRHWSGLKTCPWCGIVRGRGPNYYLGSGTKPVEREFRFDKQKFDQLEKQLDNLDELGWVYHRSHYRGHVDRAEVPERDSEDTLILRIVAATAVLCAMLIPLGFWHGYFALVGFVGFACFGSWAIFSIRSSPWFRDRHSKQVEVVTAEYVLQRKEQEIQQELNLRRSEHRSQVDRIKRSIREGFSLKKLYDKEISSMAAEDYILAMERHLNFHRIEDADILGIGPGRTMQLVAHGVETAADIRPAYLDVIPGFGPVLIANLMYWKAEVESHFVYNISNAISAGDRLRINMLFIAKQSALIEDCETSLETIEKILLGWRAIVQNLEPELHRLNHQLNQLKANLAATERGRFLGYF